MISSIAAELNDICKVYQSKSGFEGGVKNINLTVQRGEFVLIMGPSGSGKTTLLSLIAGLLKPDKGTINLMGKNLSSFSNPELQLFRAQNIGFCFQNSLLIDFLNARQNVEIVQRFGQGKSTQSVAEIFNFLKIEYLLAKYPCSMSQGGKTKSGFSPCHSK
jgi:putative ABC transport system ATP-binding protein